MRTLMLIVALVTVILVTNGCAGFPTITPAGQGTVNRPAAKVEQPAVPTDAAAQQAQAMAALMDAMFPAPKTDEPATEAPAKPENTTEAPAKPENTTEDDLTTTLDAPRAAAARQQQIDAVAAKLTARGITAEKLAAGGFSSPEEYLKYLEFAAGYLGKAWKGIPITPSETLLLWKEQKRREAEKARTAVVPPSVAPPADPPASPAPVSPPPGDKAAASEPKPDEKK